MKKTIWEFCEDLRRFDPDITARQMLHYVNVEGYGKEESVLAIRHYYAPSIDLMCQLIINEYSGSFISKAEVESLLSVCNAKDIEDAISKHYPKSLGFVMMLDVSGSMRSWLDIVKIDAKAFVRSARVYDKFGVNVFSNDAWWLYPSGTDPDMAEVTQGYKETKDAADKIEALKTYDMTNMGDAIRLGNKMLGKPTSNTDIKAFVLLSDGYHNMGTRPETVLASEPPLYVAGLGQSMRKEYFTKLLEKNPKSKFYNTPNAFEMMMMFNQILADISDSSLSLNVFKQYSAGSDYIIQPFTLAKEGGTAIVRIVWNNPNFQYTSGLPKDYLINVCLVDPDNKTSLLKPEIADPGYCIFRIDNAKSGQWKVLLQYSTQENVACTISVEEDPLVKIDFAPDMVINAGDPLFLDVSVSENGMQVTDCNVEATVTHPVGEMDFHFESNDMETDRSSFNVELKSTTILLRPSNSGNFKSEFNDTAVGGIYNVEIVTNGILASNGNKFTTIKRYAVFVE